MSNPNIKKNIRNLSAAALTALGIGAVGEGVKIVTSSSKPPVAPLIEFNQVKELPDGMNTVIKANVASDTPGESVQSATFKLANPKKLPAGVELSSTKDAPALPYEGQGTMQNISATITGPSKTNIHGEIPIEVDAVESDGKDHISLIEVPYVAQPERPSESIK